MKSTILLLMAAALAWSQAPATDPVVITVGAEKVTKSQFEAILASLSDQQRAGLTGNSAALRDLAEQIAELKTMAQEARARHMDQSVAMKAKITLQAENVLASALYQDLMKGAATDDAMQAFYKEHQKEFTQAKGRHILIRFQGSKVPVRDGQKDLTEDEALAHTKEVRAKLVAGAKFEDLAKAESDDVGSGANGGDLGTFAPGEMVEAFDKVAFDLPVGTVSEPIKSEFGYHLILIEARGPKPFAEVKDAIARAIGPEEGQKAVDALKAKAVITYDDSYFGPPKVEPVEPLKGPAAK